MYEQQSREWSSKKECIYNLKGDENANRQGGKSQRGVTREVIISSREGLTTELPYSRIIREECVRDDNKCLCANTNKIK